MGQPIILVKLRNPPESRNIAWEPKGKIDNSSLNQFLNFSSEEYRDLKWRQPSKVLYLSIHLSDCNQILNFKSLDQAEV